MKRFWISDTHFGHFNVIDYSNRPFMHEIEGTKVLFNGQVVKDFTVKGNQIFEGEKLVKELKNSSQEEVDKFLQSSKKYNSVKLMNETFIKNWNSKISKEDLVYFVGDFAFCGTEKMTEILRQLNGTKILIKGNHDKKPELMLKVGFAEVHDELEIEVDGEKVLMSHYPYVDLDLYEAALDRPNVMKIHKNGRNLLDKDIPDSKWDYPIMKKFILDNYKIPFNPNTETGKRAFKLMKRFIMALIGTRPINKGKILIHGHTHNKIKRQHNMINMSVEAWDYFPASEEEIVSLVREIKSEMDLSNKSKEDISGEEYLYYKKLAQKTRSPEGPLKEFEELLVLLNTDKPEHLYVPKDYSKAWLQKAYSLKLFIPKKDLEDGAFYLGNCRNANIAVWNKKEEVFTYVREKYNSKFLEDINPIENDNGFDLFIPMEKYTPTPEELAEFNSLKY